MNTTAYIRWAFAVLWLWSGVQPLLTAQAQALSLLAAVGIAVPWQMPLLWSASLLDIALGIWLLLKSGRAVWAAQAVVTAVYSLVIVFRLPETLSHPFAPLLKNLPLLAVMVWLASGSDGLRKAAS
ncbi:MAG: DoxX-like family protein [Neisseria sp.]|nr:DoxX-like family protein [Neisseria sp.]